MTPMAGGVANRKKYWQVAFFGFLECLIGPLPPMNWIGRVLLQVGTGGLAKTI